MPRKDDVKRSLDVFWGNTLVGSYELHMDGSEFYTYDKNYLDSKDAAPISYSLPLRPTSFNRRQLRPFSPDSCLKRSSVNASLLFLGLPKKMILQCLKQSAVSAPAL